MYRRVVMPFTILALITLLVCVDEQVGQAQIGGFKKKGGGGGGFGQDPAAMFDRMSKGKEHIVIDEQEWWAKPAMTLFAQREGITDGKLTRDQFLKFQPQWKTLGEEARKAGGFGGGFGKFGGGGDKKGPPTPADKSSAKAGEKATEKGGEKGERGEKGGKGGKGGGKGKKDFIDFDSNGDGFLNDSEIAQTIFFKNQWQKYDADKDGKISSDEWKAYQADPERFGGGKGEGKGGGKGSRSEFRGEKTPGVSVLEVEEVENVLPTVFRSTNLPEGLPSWFKELDTNKDAQVSLMEWLTAKKPPADFIRMDRNDDGLLTIEEALRYQRTTQTASAKNGEEEAAQVVLIGPDGEEPLPRTETPSYRGKGAGGKGKKGDYYKGGGGKKGKKGF
ncbi:MAG: hypothetical protein L0Z62_48700 [Gemmataceae bacterium]|nr:hypothetical protein [Gemmataceae bacterium]